MVTIQIDERTAEALERRARSAGISVAEYLRTLVRSPATSPRAEWDEIEREFKALSTPASSLPANFSRGDIYGDHD